MHNALSSQALFTQIIPTTTIDSYGDMICKYTQLKNDQWVLFATKKLLLDGSIKYYAYDNISPYSLENPKNIYLNLEKKCKIQLFLLTN